MSFLLLGVLTLQPPAQRRKLNRLERKFGIAKEIVGDAMDMFVLRWQPHNVGTDRLLRVRFQSHVPEEQRHRCRFVLTTTITNHQRVYALTSTRYVPPPTEHAPRSNDFCAVLSSWLVTTTARHHLHLQNSPDINPPTQSTQAVVSSPWSSRRRHGIK